MRIIRNKKEILNKIKEHDNKSEGYGMFTLLYFCCFFAFTCGSFFDYRLLIVSFLFSVYTILHLIMAGQFETAGFYWRNKFERMSRR